MDEKYLLYFKIYSEEFIKTSSIVLFIILSQNEFEALSFYQIKDQYAMRLLDNSDAKKLLRQRYSRRNTDAMRNISHNNI